MKTISLLFVSLPCLALSQIVPVQGKIFLQISHDSAWIHMPSVYESGNGTLCTQPPDYPLDVDATVAQVINGSITVCTGEYTAECFSLNAALNVWVEFPAMDDIMAFATNVLTPSGWWVAGGTDGGYNLNSTSLWDGSSWKRGPLLPSERYLHCMAQVNSTHTFMSGGFNEGFGCDDCGAYFSDAYLYDWSTDRWTELPEMTARLGIHACTVYTDDQGGSFILTAGGIGGLGQDGGVGVPGRSRLVQSLSLANPTEWQVLEDLPSPAQFGFFVRDGDDLVLVNPHRSNLLRFDKGSRTFSVVQGQTLPAEFVPGSTVLAISDETLSGCAV